MNSVRPPDIRQYFNKAMLTTPCPKFRESCETLWKIYQRLKKDWRKVERIPSMLEKCLKLEKEFLEIYERALAKEKECEGKKDHATQAFFYYIERIDREGEEAFRFAKFRPKRRSNPKEYWQNDAV